VDILIVKTMEYGVPKKSALHENPSSGIVRDLKINCGTIVLGRDTYRRNYPNRLTHSLPCWKRMNGIADFSKWGDHPYCETTAVFFAGPLQSLHCQVWTLATMIPRSYATLIFFLCNNPGNLEDLKHYH